jgi:hypothetical protein
LANLFPVTNLISVINLGNLDVTFLQVVDLQVVDLHVIDLQVVDLQVINLGNLAVVNFLVEGGGFNDLCKLQSDLKNTYVNIISGICC